MNPKIAAMVEAIKIINLASLMYCGSRNANIEMKMDIVNPIPAKIPTPNTRLKLTAVGSSLKPVFTAIKVAKSIPTGFPTTKPKKIPIAKGILK